MGKIRIPVEKLPPPNLNGDHVIQFRVTSEDRNKVSAWSNLFIVKSIGQYRPLPSEFIFRSASPEVSLVWDTPLIYNYYKSASMSSASIQHNHSQDFKRHNTDIFVKWDNENFEYHDRVISDSTTIVVPPGSASVRVIGVVATHNIPQKEEVETSLELSGRINEYVLGNEYYPGVLNLFEIFDTGTRIVT
jgi:hypothetical protein